MKQRLPTQYLATASLSIASACLAFLSLTAYAQSAPSKDVELSKLSWFDEQYFDRQRKAIDSITRSEFGRPLRGQLSDLRLLQRIMDETLIKAHDLQGMQAIGIAIGDIYVKEHQLEWQVYKDSVGRSRAVCMPRTSDCLFPITMVSRRVKSGAWPNIQRVYDKGLKLIKLTSPKLPYSVQNSN